MLNEGHEAFDLNDCDASEMGEAHCGIRCSFSCSADLDKALLSITSGARGVLRRRSIQRPVGGRYLIAFELSE